RLKTPFSDLGVVGAAEPDDGTAKRGIRRVGIAAAHFEIGAYHRPQEFHQFDVLKHLAWRAVKVGQTPQELRLRSIGSQNLVAGELRGAPSRHKKSERRREPLAS